MIDWLVKSIKSEMKRINWEALAAEASAPAETKAPTATGASDKKKAAEKKEEPKKCVTNAIALKNNLTIQEMIKILKDRMKATNVMNELVAANNANTFIKYCQEQWQAANKIGDEEAKAYWHKLANFYRGVGECPGPPPEAKQLFASASNNIDLTIAQAMNINNNLQLDSPAFRVGLPPLLEHFTLKTSGGRKVGEAITVQSSCENADHMALHITGNGVDEWVDFPNCSSYTYTFVPTAAGGYTFTSAVRNTPNASDPGTQSKVAVSMVYVEPPQLGDITLDTYGEYQVGKEITVESRCENADHMALHITGNGVDKWEEFPGSSFNYPFVPTVSGDYTFTAAARNTATADDYGTKSKTTKPKTVFVFPLNLESITLNIYGEYRVGEELTVESSCVNADHMALHITGNGISKWEDFPNCSSYTCKYTPTIKGDYTFTSCARNTPTADDRGTEYQDTSEPIYVDARKLVSLDNFIVNGGSTDSIRAGSEFPIEIQTSNCSYIKIGIKQIKDDYGNEISGDTLWSENIYPGDSGYVWHPYTINDPGTYQIYVYGYGSDGSYVASNIITAALKLKMGVQNPRPCPDYLPLGTPKLIFVNDDGSGAPEYWQYVADGSLICFKGTCDNAGSYSVQVVKNDRDDVYDRGWQAGSLQDGKPICFCPYSAGYYTITLIAYQSPLGSLDTSGCGNSTPTSMIISVKPEESRGLEIWHSLFPGWDIPDWIVYTLDVVALVLAVIGLFDAPVIFALLTLIVCIASEYITMDQWINHKISGGSALVATISNITGGIGGRAAMKGMEEIGKIMGGFGLKFAEGAVLADVYKTVTGKELFP